MLHIHRAERADRLLEGLSGVLAQPLADPFQPEVVAVPTRGVERWLTQRLAARLGTSAGGGDGVCANVDFPFPGRVVGDATAAATGVDRDTDPWLAQRSVWPLLDVVDERLDEPWLSALRGHLTDDTDDDPGRQSRRFSVVRHLADLFDRYGVHRPAMVQAWAEGRDADGDGGDLPADLAWQPQLWRHLHDRIGVPSPAQRLGQACLRLRDDPALLDLPARISLFGLTRLPASYLEVLAAVAAGRDVHLFLLHPSAPLWQRIDTQLADRPTPRRRDADETATTPANPLLRSWGRDAREMQLVLRPVLAAATAHHLDLAPQRTTLLQRLQADVRADAAPPGLPLPDQPDGRALLQAGDDSLRVHACHGRARQVEVVRDAILHLLSAHPHLEPRDVIVMCPDVEAFAPLIHAAFGAGAAAVDGEDTPAVGTRPEGLRVRLADRSLRQTNPVLRVVSDLLGLVDARFTASQVLDLADREPVRRRFGFDDDDLERAGGWVATAGIRWGFDAAHRRPYKLDKLEANTWQAGLRRLLAGVAVSEDVPRLVGGTVPLDDVGSSDIDLAGRFVEYVDRLAAALDGLRGPHPIAGWAEAIGAAADALTASPGGASWQRAQLQRMLDEVVGEASAAGGPAAVALSLAEVRSLFGDRLRGRPTRANFRTGHLTICTLVPMRSVPHKVVCLLGLDDGQFPRRTAVDGDDVINRDPYVGDRDPRSEDRQLLLDALLAATEHLVITYTGRDERTNAERPPAVPVGELLDVVDATVRSEDAAVPARRQIVVRHPLQPFDGRNFTAGTLLAGSRWSFDEVALAGAQALAQGPRVRPDFLDPPLADPGVGVVELRDLEAFVRHPVKAFLRRRLGVSLSDGDDELDDALPVDLNGLEQWSVGQRLLEARLAGSDMAACVQAERARGTLPPGQLGEALLDRIVPAVDDIVAAAARTGERATTSVQVNVALDGGVAVVGTVPGVDGDCIANVTFSRVGPKHRLVAWLRLLAATAGHPQRPLEAVTIGKRIGRGRGVSTVRIAALADTAEERRRVARSELAALVDLYRRGMCEPLPLYCDTSFAYAHAVHRGWEPASHARQAWESGYERPREDAEAEHQLALGGVWSLGRVLQVQARADECGEGWAADETSRLGRYARRLWDPLLPREDTEHA